MEGFRELKTHPRWAGILQTNFKLEAFKEAIKGFIGTSETRLFGYIELDRERRVSYHLNRYPRIKYAPIPGDIELDNLLFKLSTFGAIEKDQIPRPNTLKVLLALGEGYSDQVMHTPEEAKVFLGNDADIKSVLIYSVSKASEYLEDGIIIETDIKNLSKIYELAHLFKQWRFTVENLDNNTIHLVETSWCQDPDIEAMTRTR